MTGLVYCHGGGSVLGSPDSDHARCLRHGRGGRPCARLPDYRLAPEYRYPRHSTTATAVPLDGRARGANSASIDPAGVRWTSAGGALAAVWRYGPRPTAARRCPC